MKRNLILISALLLAVFLSCKEEPTDPVTPKPVGWQDDVPWPSLAASPWPMFRADAQNTGRSRHSGAGTGVLDWRYDSVNTQSGVTLTIDTMVITGSSDRNMPYIYSILNGNLKWKAFAGQIFSTPTIASDNLIYSIAGNTLNVFSLKGELKKSILFSSIYSQKAVYMGKEGSIYYIGINKLYVLNNSGDLLWSLDNTTGKDWGNELCFSPDGKTLYINGMGLASIDLINRMVKWSFGQFMTHCAMADVQGNVYFHASDDSGHTGLFSLNSDKELRWFFEDYPGKGQESYLAIDSEGNIYFDDILNLYSLNYSGKLNWSIPLIGNSSGFIAVDREGFIYSYCQKENKIALTSYDVKGNTRWTFISPDPVTSGNGIAVGYHRVYLPTWDSNIIFSVK